MVPWLKMWLRASRSGASRRWWECGGCSLPWGSLPRALHPILLRSPASGLGEDGSRLPPPRRASTTPGRRHRFLLVLVRPPRPLERPGQGAVRRGLRRRRPRRLQWGSVARRLAAGRPGGVGPRRRRPRSPRRAGGVGAAGGRASGSPRGPGAHRLPDEAVVDGEHDGGQRHGEHVGEHGGEPDPLLVGLGRHLRLLVPGVGGRLAPLGRGRVALLHGGAPAFAPVLHGPGWRGPGGLQGLGRGRPGALGSRRPRVPPPLLTLPARSPPPRRCSRRRGLDQSPPPAPPPPPARQLLPRRRHSHSRHSRPAPRPHPPPRRRALRRRLPGRRPPGLQWPRGPRAPLQPGSPASRAGNRGRGERCWGLPLKRATPGSGSAARGGGCCREPSAPPGRPVKRELREAGS